jgi:hypothetical protein
MHAESPKNNKHRMTFADGRIDDSYEWHNYVRETQGLDNLLRNGDVLRDWDEIYVFFETILSELERPGLSIARQVFLQDNLRLFAEKYPEIWRLIFPQYIHALRKRVEQS